MATDFQVGLAHLRISLHFEQTTHLACVSWDMSMTSFLELELVSLH